jgi:hypothetical protein
LVLGEEGQVLVVLLLGILLQGVLHHLGILPQGVLHCLGILLQGVLYCPGISRLRRALTTRMGFVEVRFVFLVCSGDLLDPVLWLGIGLRRLH